MYKERLKREGNRYPVIEWAEASGLPEGLIRSCCINNSISTKGGITISEFMTVWNTGRRNKAKTKPRPDVVAKLKVIIDLETTKEE